MSDILIPSHTGGVYRVGPRTVIDDHVEECEPIEADFYTVLFSEDGEPSTHVADYPTMSDAIARTGRNPNE